MKISVYLDTTIVSALFDKRTPERMAQTERFWEQVGNYEVFVSELVVDEIKGASQPLQGKMLGKLSGFTILPITDDARNLADEYVRNGIFPEKYLDDALHAALASASRIGILLSWNFTHLVKLKTRRTVALVNAIHNYNPLEIISPPEL